MKTIFLYGLLILLASTMTVNISAREIQYANCSGTLKGDDLNIQIKLYNISTNETRYAQDTWYDKMRSIYLPISDWALSGNNEGPTVNGWDWFTIGFVNLLAYIPYSFDHIEAKNNIADGEFLFNIKYSPLFAELRVRDSLLFDISFKANDSIFSNDYNYNLYVKIPYIEAEAFYEINQYQDLSNAIIDTNLFHIDLATHMQKNLAKRDYRNYSRVSIDEAIRRMFQISIIDKYINCDCHLVRVKE